MKDIKTLTRELENKGYMLFNQFDGFYNTEKDLYEVWKDNNIIVDNMTVEKLEIFLKEL